MPLSEEMMLSRVGMEIGPTDWFLVDQARIDAFADATLDHQYIHIDPDAAAKTPFGGTIAHGFLTLSLLSHLFATSGFDVDDVAMGINYGFEKVRFIEPVPSGRRIRLTGSVASIEPRGEGRYLLTHDLAVEVEGADRPAVVAQWLTMVISS